MINQNNYGIRVRNMGTWVSEFEMCESICEVEYRKDDIIIFYSSRKYDNVEEINLMKALAENNASEDWMGNVPLHCNYIVTSMYAKEIYERICHKFNKETTSRPLIKDNRIWMKRFGVNLYLERYFVHDIDEFNWKKTGAIVMNCNPFTYGHRFLIEEALKYVDKLIIFVVQEDLSLFSFEQRKHMIEEGTKDLNNIYVVPSGKFILSNDTFPEYFVKQMDESLFDNVVNDISIFAEYIAPALNIKCRFVGEENKDAVTNEYNNAMKRILPLNGIELIEIKRMECGGNAISATSVREVIKTWNEELLHQLVPDSTFDNLYISIE